MMKGLKGIITAGAILLLFAGFGRLNAANSTFFNGGISISPKVLLFGETEFARQFTWLFAFQFGKDVALNESPYYGDAWKFFLDIGGRYYFNKNFLTGYFINANIEGGLLNVPYYHLAAGNAYIMEPSFGFQLGAGYRWTLGGSRILDLNFLYGIEFTASYNGLFIVSGEVGLRMSHWFQVGIDFVMGFPSQIPKPSKTKEKLPPVTAQTNLPGVSMTNTMKTNISVSMPTNQSPIPPQPK